MRFDPGDRILVTGGTGVIGAWVVRELLEHGYAPVVVTRGRTNVAEGLLASVRPDVEFVTGDMEDPSSISDIIRRTNVCGIVHLASAKPWQIDVGYVENPSPLAGINSIILGTTHILEAARNLRLKRVVFASSKAAYSAFAGVHSFPDYLPVPETYPCNPDTIYGITKRAAELVGAYYAEHLGIDFVGARFGSTYGPFKRGADAHPATIIVKAALGEPVRLRLSAHNLRNVRDDWVFNHDVARGLRLMCETDRPAQPIYNLGSGSAHSIEDIISAVRQVLPGSLIDVEADDAAGNGGITILSHAGELDITAARQDLGYEPRYDLAAGIAATASFYEKGHVL